MKKNLILLGLILVITTLFLSGCVNNENNVEEKPLTNPNNLIGTWSRVDPPGGIEFNFTLNDDGSCVGTPSHDFEGTWGVRDNKIIIEAEVQGDKYTYNYVYILSNNNQNLTIDPLDFPTVENIEFTKHS